MNAKNTVAALAALGMFNPQPTMPPVQAPPKKCLLEGCTSPAEPGKLFCCKPHFGEFERARRAQAKEGRKCSTP